MKRKHLLAGSIVLILLMIGILAILLSNDDNDITNMEEQMFDPEQHFHIREGAEGFPSPRELEKMINEGPTPEAQLVAYRLYSRYPPDSRPLSRDMRDLTNLWQIKYVPLPIMNDPRARSEDALKKMIDELVAQGKTREEIMEQLNEEARESPRFVFELNRHTVTANDELKAILVVTDSGGSPLSIDLMSAEMKSDGHFGNIGLGSVPYEQKGPGNYLFTWKAPSADKKYWGSLTLEVRARVPGIEDEVTLTQGFYSSPIAPARFTGNASERLEKGSLLIDVELDVERECRYSLHANLYSVIDDEPTHWASVDEILKPGRQVVSFKFFGKVFHDGGYEGKFQLRDLRGTCENLPFPASWIGDPTKIKAIEQAPPVDEPLLLYVPYTDFTYTTRSYRLSDFSEDEWSSEEKNRRLDRLQNLANMPAQ